MPLIKVATNQAIKADEQTLFLRQLSAATAAMLGKPESYVMAIFEEQPQMLFAGSAEPSAHVELKSLGLPETSTADYSARICSLIEEQLGIPPERIYIEFSAPERHMWGWSGATF